MERKIRKAWLIIDGKKSEGGKETIIIYDRRGIDFGRRKSYNWKSYRKE